MLKHKNINLFSVAPVFKRKPEEALELSYAQERQWFLWQMNPDSSAYHISAALKLKGELDLAALDASFAALVARHESLRTRFVQDQAQVLQVIDAPAWPGMARERLAPGADAGERQARLQACIEAQIQQRFDLQAGPLLRVTLIEVEDDEHVLVLTQHHIVTDGWSMQLMIDELVQLYAANCSGQAPQLAALPVQYPDYALWQRQWMEAGEQERQLAYWTARLGAEHPVLELPFDRPRPAEQSFRGASVELQLEPALCRALRQLAQAEGVTPFMLLLASYQILLYRYSGQADIRVGVPVANRNRLETERLIGFFVNTLVQRAEVQGQQSLRAFLQQVKVDALGAQAHQDLPFEQLVEALRPQRSLSHSPLFQVMFNHQGGAAPRAAAAAVQVGGLRIDNLKSEGHTAQFDLTLNILEQDDTLSAQFTYALDLFDASTAQRLAGHWLNLLQAMVDNPDCALDDLALVSPAEVGDTVQRWNATAVDYPLEQSVQALIQAQVAATPEAPALVFAGRTLSYAQLDALANQWAHRLQAAGVGPDVLVGVAAERSVEMVVALLAVLKAGGAYVPLDPEYPEERLAYMIEDSGIQLLLTQSQLREQLPLPEALTCLLLDQPLSGYPHQAPQVQVTGEHLAYVIYTSGSTGKPKGAGNRHRALTNRLCWMQQAYGLTAQDRVLQKTPFSFDVSVWEFFWPLMTGACLVVAAPGVHRDPAQLIELIRREAVTTLHFVPSMLQAFVADPGAASCVGLSRIICSGEALPVDAQRQVFDKLPGAGLYNLYGPTEAAIDVTHWTCREEGRDSVPIGEPIANLQTYVLDAGFGPAPVGVVGELYLAGTGLARGYHRRPGLTAERFVASPFGVGERLYRTGDLARYRADGVIEYMGRIDHQVKIRGLRIELGEIEARLMELEQVREAVVLAVPGIGGAQLAGYVVPARAAADENAAAALRDAIKERLRAVLPDYMVPVHLMLLEQLPLSPNGKLERRALPRPVVGQAQQAYVAAHSELEKALVAIWQDVLKLERVGVHDNFFELGGDSIISIQVVSRARQAGIRFTPKDLFRHQTVQGLASVARVDSGDAEAEQGPQQGSTALLPIQQAFFEMPLAQPAHWNQSVLLRPTQVLDADALGKALQALLVQHDALRLGFVHGAQGWQAQFRPSASLGAVLERAEGLDVDGLEALANQVQRSLDLANGPLVRAVLVNLQEGGQRLLLVIHHLVVDGVSWRVLFDDLQVAYRQSLAGQPVDLGPRTHSVKAWADHLQAYARSEAGHAELAYWAQLRDVQVSWPAATPAEPLLNRHAASTQVRLDAALTRQLLQQAPAAYRTQINDLLLTALARTLVEWTGDADALVQLEGHGREALSDDIDLTRTVGWFSSLFTVRLTPAADLGASIKQVKEQLRAIPQRGVGLGALRCYGEPSVREALALLPQPRVTFNYLGQFDGSFDEQDGALFVPAGESSGQEQGDDAPLGNWLTINGQLYGGELSLNWTFSRRMFEPAVIEQLAARYIATLSELIRFCVALPTRGATPSDFPLCGLSQAQLEQFPGALEAVEDIYPLSPTQLGMLFHTQESAANLYINQTSVEVKGLDIDAFIAAWDQVVARHEILRTGFWTGNGLAEPLQVVYRQARMPARRLDWRGQGAQAGALQALAVQECERGFELLEAPLARLTVVRLDDQTCQLIWTSHHILMDGWSNSRLMGEVFESYAGHPLPAKRGHFRDYIGWLREQPQARLEQFWKPRLQNLEGATSLSASLALPADTQREGHAALYLDWDEQRTRQLKAVAQQLRVTPNTLVQAAWLLLLQRHTGQDTVCFGATVAGRPAELPGSGEMLGLFINTLPIVQTLSEHSVVSEWLQALQAWNLEVRDHEHASLAEIQRWAGQGGAGLFDSIIVFENYPVDERLAEAQDQHLQFGKASSRDVTNYAMDLAVHLGDTLKIEFLYLLGRFSEASVEQVRASFETLLQALLDQPQARLGNLGMLGQAGQQALRQANRLEGQDSTQLLAARIARHSRERPDQVALVCAGQQLTYAQLEQRAELLADLLVQRGVGPEVRVAVALERSVEMIVAFYAVMKAGGAYVPLDISYPRERQAWILQDSAASVLLTQRCVREQLPASAGARVLELDDLATQVAAERAPRAPLLAGNLAYLIYTSGSTGQPKGVAVAHGPLAMHCQAIAERYGMDAQTRELLFMSFAFDGAQERWLTTLMGGGRLVIRPNELWTPEQTWQALHEQAIDIACFPPAYLQQLAEYAEGREPPAVRIYCFGGDAVAQANYDLVRRNLRPQALTNGYGPTETVVTPLLWRVDASQPCDAVYAPIGSRVGRRTLYVLDSALNPVADGVAGELYIGGEGLARGYHQRPGISAERFVCDPFCAQGGRLYRTGDLVRRRADGVFDYLGRLDHQVKVRGFRIELGEIEARLRAQAGVRDAVVVARESGAGKQLIGYVVADERDGLAEQLRQQLGSELPDYMVPSQIVLLAALPLSPNGKVDRKALPDPQLKGREHVAPRTPQEQALVAIWQEVLELEQVGVTDNFFELGGDSLRVLKVLGKVRGLPALGLSLKLRDIMSKPTIAQLCDTQAASGAPDPLLALNRRVDGAPPLFCVHAGFGTVFDYEPLARHLEGRCTVYGVQCRMLLDRNWQDGSLAAMAVDYAQAIRHKQPEGPYQLLGWSLGAPLAVLIAQQLLAQGQAVSLLGLVDSYIPTANPLLSDWRDELPGFLEVTLGHAAAAAFEPSALPALDAVVLEQHIARLQQHAGAQGAYARVEAQELAHTFVVAMRLKALAEQLHALPAVAVDTQCWWGDGFGSPVHQAFEAALGQCLAARHVPAGHYDMLNHRALLQDVSDSLRLTLPLTH
ncbi:amino acid adenylation domain-containing protein [Pseudomonas sp. NMI795_08]|nr:non-ribosomal peptide synthetase [Pseudomonas sp. NMI795_08]MCE1117369.1 amino acid adenylation domain-containing protein [Pseudomonas sp. NMI795_08]